jgi:hypothetical protein
MGVGCAMQKARSAISTSTGRRDVFRAAGSTVAVRDSRGPWSGGNSYLERLLRRRNELEHLLAHFGTAIEQLRSTPCSAPVRKQLRAARTAEARANQALERLEWVIADTPAETIDDVALKLRFCAELQGYGGEPAGWRAPFTVEEQLLRSILADLKRLSRAQGN